MKNITDLLSHLPFLLLDGAVATELERKGADLSGGLWSAKVLLEQPELVEAVHLEYLEAGADIICTVTYQATFEGFAKKGFDETSAKGFFKKSIGLAKSAREAFLKNSQVPYRPLIAGSIGPYGAYLADGSEYRGDYKIGKVELKAFHRKRMETMVENGIDLFVFETFPNLTEARAIIELLDELATCPALFSFSCRDDRHISDGHTFREAASLAAENQWVAAVGVNCLNPNWVSGLFSSLGHFPKPLMAYPNDGNLWDGVQKCWVQAGEPVVLEQLWPRWIELGAKVIGGCCNTSPAYIAKLAAFRKQAR